MKLLCLLFLSLAAFAAAQPAKPDTSKFGTWSTIAFKESVLMSDAEQLKMRLHAVEDPKPFDVSKETFDVFTPKSYQKGKPHCLIVWISSGAKVSVPKDWEKVLDAKKIILIGARNSGNPRDIFDRMRLATDANHNMRQRFSIDQKRVWVSGISGGARVASMLGVTYADMFNGAICFMGVNFYEDVTAGKELFQANYIPADELLDIAKKGCRYALVTGSKDFNLSNTTAVFEQGFKKEGFAAVQMFNIPDQGHALPTGEWLAKCIDFMDDTKPTNAKK